MLAVNLAWPSLVSKGETGASSPGKLLALSELAPSHVPRASLGCPWAPVSLLHLLTTSNDEHSTQTLDQDAGKTLPYTLEIQSPPLPFGSDPRWMVFGGLHPCRVAELRSLLTRAKHIMLAIDLAWHSLVSKGETGASSPGKLLALSE